MSDEHDSDADAKRSEELLAMLDLNQKWIAAELMAISYQAGRMRGMSEAGRLLA